MPTHWRTSNLRNVSWSFLTGSPDKIVELAALNDVNFDRQGGFYDHNFRTLIIDPAGALQMNETFKAVGLHGALYLIPAALLATLVFLLLATRSFGRDAEAMRARL